ncbi:MAG: Gfo/Idh/MocA family oxidoreductase, partial [Chloroflexi bacterium]|nr:Gfo/Idh/MocA family oxidoreductase [Chloroflexota bacterium]
RMHFDAYLPHPERIRVVAACDTDPERVREARSKYGFAQGFVSLEEMIAQAEWEVAVVCTPTPVRRQVVEVLASAGKHVFVEKPFADSYQDALNMVEVCDRAGVKLAVNQNFRFHYPFETARDIVAQGEIGRVVSLLHQNLMFRQDVGWRTQTKRHALAVMGIHWFDGFRRLLDDEATSLVGETRSSAAIQCAGETEASIQINFSKGALVTYVESFSAPRGRTETVVFGETGQLVLTYDDLSVFDRDHRTTPSRQYENPYRGSHKPEATFTGLNLLLTALEQGGEPANNGHDNLKTVALLDGAYRSAEERRAIAFNEGIPL